MQAPLGRRVTGEPDPPAWGIAPGYHHVRGDWITAPDDGVRAALAAMGAEGPAPEQTPTWVVRRDDGMDVPFDADLETEDGGTVRVRGWLPPEGLPLGYHVLRPCRSDGGPIRLIVSPGVCPLPPRMWGWAVQLYAMRSRLSWGMGDLADLRALCSWSATTAGAGFVLVNPLHAVAPTPGQQASPYYPASRRWRNPLYLRIEDVPGAGSADSIEEAANAGRQLNGTARIDRGEVWRLKRAALEAIWTDSGARSPEWESWVTDQGDALWGFAAWCALADEHGPDWRRWPAGFRRPDAPAVAQFAEAQLDRVRFYCWLQWLVDRQMRAAAGEGAALVTDLAIGADPAGADAWQWQDVLAPGVSVGAPPDEFNPAGQDWGLPPFDPWRLRASGYVSFSEFVRSGIAPGGGLRVDHVAGLFRLFWIPAGMTASRGVYVRYPWQDLLNVLALEVDRARGFAVGEDLGTVEPEAREALARWRVLSYRLLWFEDGPPSDWPELALAAVTTHDLPTISGVLTGADLEARRAIGVEVDHAAEVGLRDRLSRVCGPDALLDVGDAVRAVYGSLASSPSLLVTATLDDVLEVDERPNQPGTVDEWPNWSIALPEPLEEIEADPRVGAVADVMRQARPPARP